MEVEAPPRLVRVAPERIVLATLGIASKQRPEEFRRQLLAGTGAVIDGDWDDGGWGTRVVNFEDLSTHRAMLHRFVDGGRWEDTAFFRRVVREIDEGTPKWSCRTRDEFAQRLVGIDALFTSIAADGYKTQRELGSKYPHNEVRVGIRRDGRLLFFDGRHRLSIARILGLSEIPVVIVARHANWVAFKEEMISYAERRLRGRLYQQLDHPDLADIPAKHDMQRIEVLRKALDGRDWHGKKLLDIGTHWGYMCQQLESLGFECLGIEANAECAAFARRLAVATEARYAIWEGNLRNFPGGRYDVVLAMSIFHHMLKTETGHRGLIDLLARLDTDLMLFEPHDPVLSAAQMEGAYRNYAPDEFAAFVAEHAGLPYVERLGRVDDAYKRPIYRLSRYAQRPLFKLSQ